MEEPIPQQPKKDSLFSDFMNPIVVTALIIVVTTIALIAIAVFGLDKGKVLESLSDGEYARGLITYLFAVGTILAFVVLILAAFVAKGDKEERDDRFSNAKEIFSLLIGIFGTIIGFYFGSVSAQESAAPPPLTVAEPVLEERADDSQEMLLTTYASGGVAPYLYIVEGGNSDLLLTGRTNGWIREEIFPEFSDEDTTFSLILTVFDVKGDSSSWSKTLPMSREAP